MFSQEVFGRVHYLQAWDPMCVEWYVWGTWEVCVGVCVCVNQVQLSVFGHGGIYRYVSLGEKEQVNFPLSGCMCMPGRETK